jgi:membrane protein DedA with SNARE-associated domain
MPSEPTLPSATIGDMGRVASALKIMIAYGVALRLHHQFQGPPIDYTALAAAAAASWLGVPGPGEPVLIAAGVFASKGRLDIGSVLFVAFAAAAAGGVAGWVLGMRAGRTVLTTRGPLHKMRLTALARGDEVFAKWPVTAILLTPSWIAGIHHVRAALYLPVNFVSAAAWAVGIGLGAYFVGPAVIDFVDDLGLVTGIGLGVLVLVGILLEVRRRRRRKGRALSQGEA